MSKTSTAPRGSGKFAYAAAMKQPTVRGWGGILLVSESRSLPYSIRPTTGPMFSLPMVACHKSSPRPGNFVPCSTHRSTMISRRIPGVVPCQSVRIKAMFVGVASCAIESCARFEHEAKSRKHMAVASSRAGYNRLATISPLPNEPVNRTDSQPVDR